MEHTASQLGGALSTEVISRRVPGEGSERYGESTGGTGAGMVRRKSSRTQVGERNVETQVYKTTLKRLSHDSRKTQYHIRGHRGSTHAAIYNIVSFMIESMAALAMRLATMHEFEAAGELDSRIGPPFHRLSPVFEDHCVSSITSTIISRPHDDLMTCWVLWLPWVRQSGIRLRICVQCASMSSFCQFL